MMSDASPKTQSPKNNSSSTVGDGISAPNAQWDFSGSVAETFTSHVRRSVPLYDEGHDLICRFSDYFVHSESIVYELGTSTGNLLNKLSQRHNQKTGVKFVGIDIEEPMIEKARSSFPADQNLSWEVADIGAFDYEAADIFVSYYTIQFIRPRVRQALIDRIYERLNWGGAFFFFEKVRAPDARFQDMCSGIYNDFKLEQGFSDSEILNKTRSLKGVLEPFSTQGNIDLLKRAGFTDIMTIMKHVPFEGFLAIK